ncbi:MAG: 2,3-bisphosphoglycerate-independent phosphoglycerate mutase [Candidatus Colwellbacteria bacterium]|nr:2,3-bisphosphoglycerate-independent phosphoglycerate mutase [Candidatus Colwellbacteria bacterium]
MAKKTVVMVILDGWGIGKHDASNPIYELNPKNIDFIKHNYSIGSLQASGIAVGLPWEEEGNSEVGHLTLGSGRVIYQHYPRISISLRDESFYSNKVLLGAFNHAREHGGAVNLIGILTGGNVHAALEHLEGLLKLAERQKAGAVNLHLFTDGKDSPPKSVLRLLQKLDIESYKARGLNVRIASIAGRYYGMDRDLHWKRTERAYAAITGASSTNNESNTNIRMGAAEYIELQYAQGLTDEFIEPKIIDPSGALKSGDATIFFNFREDSIRQLTEMFIENINSGNLKDLNVATFTEYNKKFPFPVAFPPEDVVNSLGKVLSDEGFTQLRIAETNKYAHVTYFFNGYLEKPFKNEYRVLVPSKNVPRYDEVPEMSARDITARALEAIKERAYDFILINYANADIVAHTGNFDATVKAVSVVDEQIGILMKEVLRTKAVMLITSDHGNAEKVLDLATGLPETQHDPSPVPVYVIGEEYKKPKGEAEISESEKLSTGLISDVAPTVLDIMGVQQPPEMTGVSLLQSLI